MKNIEYLNYTQAANRLGVDPSTVKSWIYEGLYEYTLVGKRKRIIFKDGVPIPTDKWNKDKQLIGGEDIEYLTKTEASRRTGWSLSNLDKYTEIYGYARRKLGKRECQVFKGGKPLKEENIND